ncbi:MAG: serine/threonine protein kinase [Polyangiaceae bacterium]|nr:serine/threonine protein kinase [Polyangiaceae bacterium]
MNLPTAAPENPADRSGERELAVGSPGLRVGQQVGRYELLLCSARGGMAEVWLARTRGARGFEKHVALKTVLPHLVDEPEFLTMFVDEARIASRIVHPNVAQVLDLGEHDGIPYLVFEWIDGEPLSMLSRRAQATGTPISIALALRIVRDVCAGLHAAHELCDDNGRCLQVVHRDVSPQNIVVCSAGAVKVIDFGIAKALDRMMETTAEGKMKGKIRYMAPEHARGGHIDRRADLWSAGVVLYQLLSGRPPYEAESPVAVLDMLLSGVSPPPLPARVPAEVAAVVVEALKSNPNQRFQTAADMQSALAMAARCVGPPVTDADLAQFVRRHRRGQSVHNASEAAGAHAPGRGKRVSRSSALRMQTVPFEPRQPPRLTVPPEFCNSTPPVSVPRAKRSRTLGLLTVFAMASAASVTATSKLGNSEAPFTFSVPTVAASSTVPVLPASSSARTSTGFGDGTSAQLASSATLTAPTQPASPQRPDLSIWGAAIREGQDLIAQGKVRAARSLFDRAFAQTRHPALLNMREHVRIASSAQGPCSVVALGRPRSFDMVSPASAPVVLPLPNSILFGWTSHGDAGATVQVVALDSALHTWTEPTEFATAGGTEPTSLLFVNASGPTVLLANGGGNLGLSLRPLGASGEGAPPRVRVVSSPDLGSERSAALDRSGNLWVAYYGRRSEETSGFWLRRLTNDGLSEPLRITGLDPVTEGSNPVAPRLVFAENTAKLSYVRPSAAGRLLRPARSRYTALSLQDAVGSFRARGLPPCSIVIRESAIRPLRATRTRVS